MAVLEELREVIDIEQYEAIAGAALGQLETALEPNLERDLNLFEPEIRGALEEEVVLRFHLAAGMVERSLTADPTVLRAQQVFGPEMQSVLGTEGDFRIPTAVADEVPCGFEFSLDSGLVRCGAGFSVVQRIHECGHWGLALVSLVSLWKIRSEPALLAGAAPGWRWSLWCSGQACPDCGVQTWQARFRTFESSCHWWWADWPGGPDKVTLSWVRPKCPDSSVRSGQRHSRILGVHWAGCHGGDAVRRPGCIKVHFAHPVRAVVGGVAAVGCCTFGQRVDAGRRGDRFCDLDVDRERVRAVGRRSDFLWWAPMLFAQWTKSEAPAWPNRSQVRSRLASSVVLGLLLFGGRGLVFADGLPGRGRLATAHGKW